MRLIFAKEKTTGKLSRTIIVWITLMVALLAWLRPWAGEAAASADLNIPVVAPRGTLLPEELSNISVFKVASPSVVHITTIDLAANLFTMDVMQIPRGTGTGVIWDDKGHIVTNYHVIQGADAAKVTLADQTTWKASLVGAFPDRDLAVLRINAPKEKLKPILLGESGSLQVGQKVYAIGNPFGLDQTLTTGIVSALNREIQSVTNRAIRNVIQTDAAINPGNSGGPLLDSAGRMIGVNTAIYSPSGAYAGIGFSIPVDEVRRVVPRLIRDGRFKRPTLGIRSASDKVREALGLPQGVVVADVDRNSPASQAGIRPFYRNKGGEIVAGDEIIAIGKFEIKNSDDLIDALEKSQSGELVDVHLIHNDVKRIVKVELE